MTDAHQEGEGPERAAGATNARSCVPTLRTVFGRSFEAEMRRTASAADPAAPAAAEKDLERWRGHDVPWEEIEARLGRDLCGTAFRLRDEERPDLPNLTLEPSVRVTWGEPQTDEADEAGGAVAAWDSRAEALRMLREGVTPKTEIGGDLLALAEETAEETSEVTTGTEAAMPEVLFTESPVEPLEALDAPRAATFGGSAVLADAAFAPAGSAEAGHFDYLTGILEEISISAKNGAHAKDAEDLEDEDDVEEEGEFEEDFEDDFDDDHDEDLDEDEDEDFDEDEEDEFGDDYDEEDVDGFYDDDEDDDDEEDGDDDEDDHAYVPVPRRTLTIRADYVPKTRAELLAEEEVRSVITSPLSSVSARLRAQNESRGSSFDRMTHQMVGDKKKGRRNGPRRGGPMPVLPSDATMQMLWGGGAAEEQNAYGRKKTKNGNVKTKNAKFAKKKFRQGEGADGAQAQQHPQKKKNAKKRFEEGRKKFRNKQAADAPEMLNAPEGSTLEAPVAKKKPKKRRNRNDEMAGKARRERVEAMRAEERADPMELPPGGEMPADDLATPFRPKRPRPEKNRRQKVKPQAQQAQEAAQAAQTVQAAAEGAPQGDAAPQSAQGQQGQQGPREERRTRRLYGRNRNPNPKQNRGPQGNQPQGAQGAQGGDGAQAPAAKPNPQKPNDGFRKGQQKKFGKKPQKPQKQNAPKQGPRRTDEAGDRMPGANAWASSSFGFSGRAASTYLSGSALTLPQVTPAAETRGFGTVFGSGGQPDNVIRPGKPNRTVNGNVAPKKNAQGKPKRFFKKGGNRNG